ncbi:MAG: hypothetical protein R3E42_06970 [Burkholderiaceae bacterium]
MITALIRWFSVIGRDWLCRQEAQAPEQVLPVMLLASWWRVPGPGQEGR